MKIIKPFLLGSLLIATTTPTFCQQNDSIIDKDKVWYNYLFYYMSMSVNTELFGIGADTVINDTTYNHVLHASGGIQVPVNKYGNIRVNI